MSAATAPDTTEVAQIRVVRDTYCDSLRLLVATSAMSKVTDVFWAGAVMATPAGLETLAAKGFEGDVLAGLGSNELVLAVLAADQASAGAALDAGAEAAFAEEDSRDDATAKSAPRTLTQAAGQLPGANVAVVSVAGQCAALEAHHALTCGMHVLLFSDNVPIEEEAELKDRANSLGLLVMGPGAGTAILAGTGLGFANQVRRGPVGVVAAAGTGAQEVSALLDRWGVGVSHVIGVGGRDLSADIDGRMAKAAVRALEADSETAAILVVSKPPDEAVAREVLAECATTPAVATFLGVAELDGIGTVRLAPTLEAGALTAARLVGTTPPAPSTGLSARVARCLPRIGPARRTVRGYFSGGTLCYEAQLIIGQYLGPVYSNEPLVHEHSLPAPNGAHVLLDLGAEEYTVGRPHPMIDPSSRIDLLREQGRDAEVAVVLLDVVLGHGAHPDPAAELLPVLAELMVDGGPQVVAYVLGSDSDPQDYGRQRSRLEDIGCIVTETAARAAYAAAAIACRRPELAEES